MRSAKPVRATRLATVFAIAALAMPAAIGPTAAADPVIFTAGTTQDFDSSNPYQTALVSGYEAFQLSFDLLVGFGLDTKPIPGFADSWTRNPDNVTFHIRTGMKWSDGQPATSADACFSWQLALDAHAAGGSIGLGYLDTGVSDAGVTKVSCPTPDTMIAYTTDQSDRVYQVYLPIVPQHIYGKDTYKTIGDEPFKAPLVGTGPYQLAEWKTGQFMRFTRNPNYWGTQGYADEVVLQIYSSSDTMVQALKAGDLQYAHGVNAQQLDALKTTPNIQTVVGSANGWSQLAFNVYGTGTGKTIPGGGPSTQALLDPKFRDALGYAIDKPTLVAKVLGGYGEVGTTIVPPVLGDEHIEPAQPRTFDINLAKQKLDAAGYTLDANGKRLDLQGKPIVLRLVMPNSDANYPKAAEFIKDWYGQLGIELQTQVYDSNTLVDLLLPPEAGGKTNKANYDIELWGWAGNPDPDGLLMVFLCNEIGSLSDSNFCDQAYDSLYAQQLKLSGAARNAVLATMQNLIYGLAPYDILYYDSNLDAYRTDKFAGLQNMPANGTPLFTYGTFNYTQLTNAAATPTPGPSSAASAAPGTSSAPATPGPSATPSDTSSGGSNTTLLIVVIVVVLLVVILAWWLRGRRKAAAVDEEG